MIPVAFIEHQLSGRLRLRIPTRRGDVSFFQRVVAALSKHPDVKELNATPLTGSILIRHSGPVLAITAAAVEQGLFEIGKREPKTPPKQARPIATPPADPGMLDTIATGLSGLALFQVTQGEAIGNAAENFWNAYGAHRILGRSGIAAGFALLGVYQLLRGQFLGSGSSLLFYSLVTRRLAASDWAAGAMTDKNAASKSAATKTAEAKSTASKRANGVAGC